MLAEVLVKNDIPGTYHPFALRPMRRLALLTLIGAAACASSTSIPVASHPTSIPIVGSDVRITANDAPYTTTFAFSVERVWRTLPVAFDSLGLPLTVMDAKQHLIGNQGVKLRQQLGGVPLSKYMDCGHAQNVASADSYEVFLSLVATVQSNANGGADLVTTMEAAARPLTYAQDYSRCSTSGTLQNRLAALVRATLAR